MMHCAEIQNSSYLQNIGYMPICRRYGFLYDCPTAKYVAIAAECIYGETEQPVAMSMMNLERRW